MSSALPKRSICSLINTSKNPFPAWHDIIGYTERAEKQGSTPFCKHHSNVKAKSPPHKISINNEYQSLHLGKTDKASSASFVSKRAIALLCALKAAKEFGIRYANQYHPICFLIQQVFCNVHISCSLQVAQNTKMDYALFRTPFA